MHSRTQLRGTARANGCILENTWLQLRLGLLNATCHPVRSSLLGRDLDAKALPDPDHRSPPAQAHVHEPSSSDCPRSYFSTGSFPSSHSLCQLYPIFNAVPSLTPGSFYCCTLSLEMSFLPHPHPQH